MNVEGQCVSGPETDKEREPHEPSLVRGLRRRWEEDHKERGGAGIWKEEDWEVGGWGLETPVTNDARYQESVERTMMEFLPPLSPSHSPIMIRAPLFLNMYGATLPSKLWKSVGHQLFAHSPNIDGLPQLGHPANYIFNVVRYFATIFGHDILSKSYSGPGMFWCLYSEVCR